MWKFLHFSALRFSVKSISRNSKGQKLPFLYKSGALNLNFSIFLHFLKAKIYLNQEFIAPEIAKKGIFFNIYKFTFSKIDFTENLSDRKY